MTIDDITVICTDADYKKALGLISRLWDATAGTPEGDKFEALATLVDAYERQHTPVLPPKLIEAINFRMEQEAVDPFPSRERLIEKWEQEIETWKQEKKIAPELSENIDLIISDLEVLVDMLKDK